MIRKIIKALWIFLAVIVLAIVIVFVSISKGWIGSCGWEKLEKQEKGAAWLSTAAARRKPGEAILRGARL